MRLLVQVNYALIYNKVILVLRRYIMVAVHSNPYFNPVNILKDHIRHANAASMVVARNISNANTPGYKSEVVEDFKKSLRRKQQQALPVNITHHNHFVLDAINTGFKIYPRKNFREQSPDGNTVSLEQEMQDANEHSQALDLSVSLYKAILRLYKSALLNK